MDKPLTQEQMKNFTQIELDDYGASDKHREYNLFTMTPRMASIACKKINVENFTLNGCFYVANKDVEKAKAALMERKIGFHVSGK